MQEKSIAVIDKSILAQLESEYHVIAKQAHTDLTPASDIQAAFLAPATFLTRPSNFEATFDQILFHLDEAYKKSDESSAQKTVSRMAESVFADLIYVIQNRLSQISEENKKGLFKKLTQSAQNITKNVLGIGQKPNADENQKSEKPKLDAQSIIAVVGSFKNTHPALLAAVTIGPEVGNLFEAFTGYLVTKWEVEKEESYFYNQLVHVYEKILDSACYDSRGLLQNTFIRTKDQIIYFVVEKKGITAALNLSKYDTTSAQSQETSRLIVMSLAVQERWDEASAFLLELKKKDVSNVLDIQNQLSQSYRSFLERKNGILSSSKEHVDIDVEVEKYVLKSTDPAKYEALLVRLAKNKRTKKILSLAKIAAVLAIIISGLFYRWNSYQKVAKIESTRINSKVTEIGNLVSQKEYQRAISTIEDGVVWQEERLLLSGNDEDKTEELKKNESRIVLQAIVEDLSQFNKSVMNDSVYNSLNQTLLAPYEFAKQHVSKENLEMFEQTIQTVLAEIDNKRNEHLLNTELEIQGHLKNGDYSKALALANNLFHYSDAKYTSKLGVFSTSFKEYWDKEKEKNLKEIQKQESENKLKVAAKNS